MKHTPGPWTFYTEPQPNGCPIVGSRGLMIAMLAHSVLYSEQKNEAIANARLIAAAPDLLEAMQWAVKELERLDEANAQMVAVTLRAAIAKATGEQA